MTLPLKSTIINYRNGYTLLETVVALTILVGVVVPLFSHMYRGLFCADLQRELTGAWMLEQEALLNELHPEKIAPVKRITLNECEWRINCEKTTALPAEYLLSAETGGKTYATVRYYGK